MSITVRGKAKVEWRPNYTLDVDSPDGTSLPADGFFHDFTATLTNTTTGDPIPNRTLKLKTDPIDRDGHNQRKTTDANGEVTYRIADSFDEVVVYTVSLLPDPPTSVPTITADETITWGTGALLVTLSFTCPPVQVLDVPIDVTCTATVSGSPVSGISITLQTNPGGKDGDGEIKVTNGSGVATWTVVESIAGLVQYDASAISPGTIQSMNTADCDWV